MPAPVSCARRKFKYGVTELPGTMELNEWYHVVIVIVPVDALEGSARWRVYVNGRLMNWAAKIWPATTLTALQGANYPQAVARPISYLGTSYAGSGNWVGLVDALRVYSYALRQPVISRLAALYGLNLASPLPLPGSAVPRLLSALRSTAEFNIAAEARLPFQPVFNLPLAVSPQPYVGSSTAYSWLPFDPADSPADQSLHRGLVALYGNASQYVDLSALTGEQSVGQVSPIPFGFGGSEGETETQGWTVELVLKPLQQSAGSKLLELASGNGIDALYVGWQSGSDELQVGQYSGLDSEPTAIPVGQLNLSTWYHLALVMQPHTTNVHAAGNATAAVYLNAQLVAQAASLSMPLPVYRQDSYLGKAASAQDPTAQAVYDALRIWDRALTQQQVQQLANVYGLDQA